ncbi:MAG: pyridoxamine 5'-phosphate oxidase family protein [Pseudomonadota bacterium]
MTDWWQSLDGTLDQAWTRMSRGVADRRSPARHPVLATAGLDGGGEARIVVLRGASRAKATLEAHTDAASAKAAELAANPKATVLVWDQKANFQMRWKVHVDLISADAVRWAKVPSTARQVYGGSPEPGGALADPEDFQKAPDLNRFLVLHCQVTALETLHLGQDQHGRARFTADDQWIGQWVAP